MTTKEAAENLGVSANFVAILCKRGKLKAKRHGWAWDIDPVSVELYKATPKDKGGRPKKTKQKR